MDINKPPNPLKAFFWDKIRDNEIKPGTVWATIGKEDIRIQPSQMRMLVDNFTPQVKKSEPKVVKETKPTVIACIDGKKS